MNNLRNDRKILIYKSQTIKERFERLQKTKFRATLILLAMLSATLIISLTFSSLMNSVVIRNSGQILLSPKKNITAKSGSPEDIQAAVDEIDAAGGGIVYVPQGDFVFNIDPSKTAPNGYPAGVIIPGGVSVIGQGKDKTILRQTQDNPVYSSMFFVDGINGQPVRISGIKFDGYVETTETYYTIGVYVLRAKDFRIDHNSFEDFSSTGLEIENYLQPYGVNRGVVDHNDFDNPYKDNIDIPGRIWGYGSTVVGTCYNWETDINKLLGHYDDIDNVVYFEDNTFRRCRHCIAANGGAHYVARHNYFTEMIISWYGSYVDAHGSSGAEPAVGTRAVEIYDNIIENSPTDYRSHDDPDYWGQYLGMGVGIRGGGGVIFNNTLMNLGVGIQIYSDATWAQCEPHNIWIWDNQFDGTTETFVVLPPSVENVDYFLYEKPGYTPYPYPHPLTLEATP